MSSEALPLPLNPERQTTSPLLYRSTSTAPPVATTYTQTDDDDTDALDEVIMAVDLRGRGRVGCSYYVAREEKLYFMEDVQLGGIEIVESRQDRHLYGDKLITDI